MKSLSALLLFSISLFTLSVSDCNSQILTYLSSKDQHNILFKLNKKYPALSKLHLIGKSAGGREIYAVELGTGFNLQKPALLIIGGIEPDDLAGTIVALNFVQSTLSKSSTDSIKIMLDNFTIYIIPSLSPDPLEGNFEIIRSIHKGNNEKDDEDRDGLQDEDGYEDLNDDGVITLMRISEPGGEWIENPEELALLKKADANKGEAGKYQLLFEGIDSDKDGKVNEDPPGGTNINNNTTYNYKAYTSQGGDHPFSSPELRTLGDFLFERPNILAVYSFTYTNNIIQQWKIKYPKKPGEKNIFSADSAAYAAFINDLKPLASFKGEKEGNGDIPGWAYYDAGRFSFSSPAWSYPEMKDSTNKRDKKNEEKSRKLLAYNWIKNNKPQNFLMWQEISHPDFRNSKVEVGGFIPFTENNPPQDSLKTVSLKAEKLFLKILSGLPVLRVDKPLIEPLGMNVFRLTLTLKNMGSLPTHTIAGRKVKALQPVIIKIKFLDGQKLAAGKPIEFIEDPIPGGGAVQKSYIIIGKGNINLNIGSPSAGYQNISIKI